MLPSAPTSIVVKLGPSASKSAADGTDAVSRTLSGQPSSPKLAQRSDIDALIHRWEAQQNAPVLFAREGIKRRIMEKLAGAFVPLKEESDNKRSEIVKAPDLLAGRSHKLPSSRPSTVTTKHLWHWERSAPALHYERSAGW